MQNNNLKDSEIQLAHLNANMGVKGVRERIRDSIYGTLSFFLSRTPDSIISHSDISDTVDPVISRGGDVIGFSEVYGLDQLDYVMNALESRGYKTYQTEAFEMWSQNEDREHLYNVLGVKSPYADNSKLVNADQLKNKRKLEGKIVSLAYMLRSDISKFGSEIVKSLDLNRRLVNGILDGAITTIDLGDSLKFSHLHVHADNPDLESYFTNHVFKDVPHVMMGDFNIGNIHDFLLRPPFSGKDYETLLPDGSRTFPFSKGFGNVRGLFHGTPDNIIGNRFIENIHASTFKSASDHDGIISRIKIR